MNGRFWKRFWNVLSVCKAEFFLPEETFPLTSAVFLWFWTDGAAAKSGVG